MFVRLNIGAYSGEVRDLAFEAADAMIKNGSAEKVDFSQPALPPRELAPTPAKAVDLFVDSLATSSPAAAARRLGKKKTRHHV